MQLKVPEHNAKLFAFSPETKHAYADISDLGEYSTGHLYDDAEDIGLAMRNPVTGTTTRWHFVEEIRSAENELTGWLFRPTPETVRKHSQMEGWELTVVND